MVEPGRDAAPRDRARQRRAWSSCGRWPCRPTRRRRPSPGRCPTRPRRATSPSAASPGHRADDPRLARPRRAPGEHGPRVRPGDVLVLVCAARHPAGAAGPRPKQAGVPVAGADRLALREHIAVQDLIALGRAMLLPEDDLNLACLLKSPLLGLGRGRAVRARLGRGGRACSSACGTRPAAAARSAALRAAGRLAGRADLMPPFEFYTWVLGADRRPRACSPGSAPRRPSRSRRSSASLAYEEGHPASLEGFLHWLGLGSDELKRDPEQARDVVRVMTVHGAKGLEAPIVFLADAGPRGDSRRGRALGAPEDGPLPFWRAPQASARPCAPRSRGASAAAELRGAPAPALRRPDPRARPALRHRLAARRAAGRHAEAAASRAGTSWSSAALHGCRHRAVERSLRRAAGPGAAPGRGAASGAAAAALLPAMRGAAAGLDPPTGRGRAPTTARARAVAAEASRRRDSPPARTPGAVPARPARPPPAAAAAGPRAGASGRRRPSRLLAGTRPRARRPQRARSSRPRCSTSSTRPEFAALFGPGSRAEQAICGTVGGRPMVGPDRPARGHAGRGPGGRPTRPTASRRPRWPRHARGLPRQLAAYRALLQQLYPAAGVRCGPALDRGAAAGRVPAELLDRHAPGPRA